MGPLGLCACSVQPRGKQRGRKRVGEKLSVDGPLYLFILAFAIERVLSLKRDREEEKERQGK